MSHPVQLLLAWPARALPPALVETELMERQEQRTPAFKTRFSVVHPRAQSASYFRSGLKGTLPLSSPPKRKQ